MDKPVPEKEFDGTVAFKADSSKPNISLVPTKALEEITKAFDYGAKKYSPYNWAKGFTWRRLIDATYRHINAFNGGEDVDPETGLSHIAHAGACIMMLLEHQKRNLGTDDRHKWEKK